MKVLMIIDMQQGFINDNNKFLIDKINNLIKSSQYDRYIFTVFKNKGNSLYEKKLKWTRLQNSDEQKIVVDIPKNAIIFEKYGYGISNRDLNLLKENKIKEIDICGVQTDACVYAIALQLFDNGIYPNVLINYTMTISEDKQNNAKEMFINQFGGVNNRL